MMTAPEVDLGEIADTFAELSARPLPQGTNHPTSRVYAAFIVACAVRHGDRAPCDRCEIEGLIAQAEQLYRGLPSPPPAPPSPYRRPL